MQCIQFGISLVMVEGVADLTAWSMFHITVSSSCLTLRLIQSVQIAHMVKKLIKSRIKWFLPIIIDNCSATWVDLMFLLLSTLIDFMVESIITACVDPLFRLCGDQLSVWTYHCTINIASANPMFFWCLIFYLNISCSINHDFFKS